MATEMAHNLGKLTDTGSDKVSKQFRDLIADGPQGHCHGLPWRPLPKAGAMRAAIEGIVPAAVHRHHHACGARCRPKGCKQPAIPVFCTFWTLLGLPAITLPLLTGEDDMPLGVQLVGAPGDDARLLRTAQWLVTKLVGAQ